MLRHLGVTLSAALGAMALVGLVGVGGARAASIVASEHDLSTKNATTTEVCVFCHTPHNPSATIPVALWNRDDSTETYTMYDSSVSPTIDMSVAGSPQGVSLACLSCHDGVTAYDALINTPPGFTADAEAMGSGGAAVGLGGDLTDDHPISVTYDPLLDPAFDSAANVIAAGVPLFGTGADQVECASCHNVHDPAIDPFLRISNASSGLCLTCHIK